MIHLQILQYFGILFANTFVIPPNLLAWYAKDALHIKAKKGCMSLGMPSPEYRHYSGFFRRIRLHVTAEDTGTCCVHRVCSWSSVLKKT